MFVCLLSLSLLCFSSYVHKFVVFSRLFKALGLRDVEFSGSEPKANHPTPTSLPFTAFTNLQNKFRQDECFPYIPSPMLLPVPPASEIRPVCDEQNESLLCAESDVIDPDYPISSA